MLRYSTQRETLPGCRLLPSASSAYAARSTQKTEPEYSAVIRQKRLLSEAAYMNGKRAYI